jgi:uncharacterized protein (TIGR03000 family)
MLVRSVSRAAVPAAVALLLFAAAPLFAQPGGGRFPGSYPSGTAFYQSPAYLNSNYSNPSAFTGSASYNTYSRFLPTYDPRSYIYTDAYLPNVYRNLYGSGYGVYGDIAVAPGQGVRYQPFSSAADYTSPTASSGGGVYQSTWASPAVYPPVPLPAAAPSSAPAALQGAAPANVVVQVPADAEVWFDDHKTKQSGGQRTFTSPPLQPGRTFTYEVKARWTQDGKPVERTQTIKVQGGETSQVEFRSDGGK